MKISRCGGVIRVGLVLALVPALALADSPKTTTVEELQKTLEAQSVEMAKLKQAALTMVPAGTVIAYAGPIDGTTYKLPPGWLLCDGKEASSSLYPNLCQALGNVYGTAAPGNCKLPDYKGRFLRGLDDTASRDPQAKVREPMFPGSARGATVGTIQDFATSLRGIRVGNRNALSGSNRAAIYNCEETVHEDIDRSCGEPNLHKEGDQGNHDHPLEGGADETRPRNAAVIYLIRAY
jgi:hypothetical protein